MRSIPVYEVVKTRVLIKLQDRLDTSKSRRMPTSLFQETARQQVEQVIEVEAARLPRTDRDRLLIEVIGEAFGYGPLEELFGDPTLKEVVVLGPEAVIARREHGWMPTNVKFRDEDHLLEVLDKGRMHGEAIGGAMPASILDAKLSNGFRVVAVIPPPALGQPPTAAFVRLTDAPVPASVAYYGNGTHTQVVSPSAAPPPASSSSSSGTHLPQPAAVGSGRVAVSGSRSSATRSPAPGEYPLERHRVKITERLIAKLANLGVYDLTRVEPAELRKVVAAYVEEHCRVEHIYLSDTDQGRLTLEILTGMNLAGG